nr:hypothetical protein [Tanacetum cinerariifolium]
MVNKKHTVSNYLCEELIDEILERLPPKSLLRFRSVSKSWCHRISSRNFIRNHTFRCVKTATWLKPLLHHRIHFNKDGVEFSFALDPTDVHSSNEVAKFSEGPSQIVGSCFGILCLKKITASPSVSLWNPSIGRQVTVPDYPFGNSDIHFNKDGVEFSFALDPTDVHPSNEVAKFSEGPSQIVGSCFGILCLKKITASPSVSLWNPSIRRQVTVPDYPFGNSDVAYGFGFDPTTDDYKIAGLSCGDVQSSYVYSVKTNSWNEIQLPATPFSEVMTWACFVNGALHWATRHSKMLKKADIGKYQFTLTVWVAFLSIHNHNQWPIVLLDQVRRKKRKV